MTPRPTDSKESRPGGLAGSVEQFGQNMGLRQHALYLLYTLDGIDNGSERDLMERALA